MPGPYEPSNAYLGRLPGTPGGPQAPAWSSPQGLYEYIAAHVPGISPQAAEWLHSRLLGGQTVTGDTLAAQLGGLTIDQLNAINALTPFSGNAPTVQPNVPGDPSPGQAGQGGNLVGPAPPFLGNTDFSGTWGYGGVYPPLNNLPLPPSTDVSGNVPRPIRQPPAENATVAPNTAGYPNYPGYPPYVPPQAITGGYPEDVGPTERVGVDPISMIDMPGGAHSIGVGAHYAERALGMPQPLDYVGPGYPSPIKYLARPKRWQY